MIVDVTNGWKAVPVSKPRKSSDSQKYVELNYVLNLNVVEESVCSSAIICFLTDISISLRKKPVLVGFQPTTKVLLGLHSAASLNEL